MNDFDFNLIILSFWPHPRNYWNYQQQIHIFVHVQEFDFEELLISFESFLGASGKIKLIIRVSVFE